MAKNRFKGSKLGRGFQTDKQAEAEGIWRRHPEYGIHVRIRRSTIHDHKLAVRKYYKPFQHLTRPHPRDELLVKQKAAAETLVADWGQDQEDENGDLIKLANGDYQMGPLLDADGKEIRPTQENILDAFIEMPDFFEWVSGEADTFEHYRVEALEGAGGNSSRSSDGSANGEQQAQAPSSNGEPSEETASALSSESPS